MDAVQKLPCVVCKITTDGWCSQCKLAMCQSCNREERHDGVFICPDCKLMRCNTYYMNSGNGEGICYYCNVNKEISTLNNAIPGFGDMALRYIAETKADGDASLSSAICKDINTAYDDKPGPYPKREKRH